MRCQPILVNSTIYLYGRAWNITALLFFEKGGISILDIKKKEQAVKQKAPVSRLTENAPRQAAANTAKRMRQLMRTVEHGGSAPREQSAERQAEDQAGEIVRKTTYAAVYGVETTARFAAGVRRWIESGRNQSVKEKAEKGADDFLPAGSKPESALPHDRETPDVTYHERCREQARSHLKERMADRRQGQTSLERSAGNILPADAANAEPRRPKIRRTMPATKPRKPPAPRLRDTSAPDVKSAQTACVPGRRARLRAIRGRQNSRFAVRGTRGAAQKLVSAFRKATLSLKSLPAALLAGGAVAVTVVLLVCLIAMVAGSSFGIFFAAQPTGNGTTLQTVVRQLSEDYYAQIREIEEEVPHDRLAYVPDGPTAIRWEDVLSVFAAELAAAENGQPVAVLEQAQAGRLEEILWQMNPVSHRTYTEEHEEEHTTTDENGNECTETVTVTETVLEITLLHRTPQEMATALGFTARQNEQLALLSDPQYKILWMELLGGYVSGSGQIITPENVPVGSGLFQWPLPEAFTITSGFGERVDPFTGESDFHTGTDIVAPKGTPILAAADGTVTIANATDPWGGGYGYYIKLDHCNGLETLYAHCSAICVTPGQTVQKGEVIGYVGSTGNSTGNHLHFEVWINQNRIDVMDCFIA